MMVEGVKSQIIYCIVPLIGLLLELADGFRSDLMRRGKNSPLSDCSRSTRGAWDPSSPSKFHSKTPLIKYPEIRGISGDEKIFQHH